jgi:glycosyltransferase involved in cell wall biosynthesis
MEVPPVNVAVIIPVGPGHEEYSVAAVASVRAAWQHNPGPFRNIVVDVVEDTEGKLGRSAARNLGLDRNRADWHFLMDADDEMTPGGFALADTTRAATFGAVCLNGVVMRENRRNVAREDLFVRGALGTLSMGFFLYGGLGRRFNETMDAGEDFDFYLRLPDFVKRDEPIVSIGRDKPSAGGPRGYQTLDWVATCNEVIRRYRP